jgi:hypothetical protein
MKRASIAITATFDESGFLGNLVEKLADRRNDPGYSFEKVQPGWLAIETSSLEAHVSGDIILADKKDLIKMPFVTCFLFTCTKRRRGEYKLTWANSLS